MNNKSKSKYGYSANENKCIGPCVEKNTLMIHPSIPDYFVVLDRNECPVYGTSIDTINEPCRNPEKNINPLENLRTLIDDSPKNILKNYYQITTVHECYNFLKLKNPLYTKMRILECFWKVYGRDINIVNDIVVHTYIDICKQIWIREIYKKLKPNIRVSENKIYYDANSKIKNSKNNKKYKIEKINYIFKKIITEDWMRNFFGDFCRKINLEVKNFNEYIKNAIIKKLTK